MILIPFFAAAALLGMDPVDRTTPSSSPPNPAPPVTLMQARPLDTPAAEVRLGDVAPNFSYQGVDGRWRHLADLVREGRVLLVFGANELVLRVLEHERDALMDLGVLPVAVVDARAGAAQAMVERLHLEFTVLADPQGTIAAQFNAVDLRNGLHLPAWFALDGQRRVKGLARKTLPVRGYPALAAEAFGLPVKGRPVPASK